MTQALSWTLSRGTVYDKHRVYFLAYSNREPGTRVFRWTGKWDNYYVPGVAVGICSLKTPQPEILTLCADGMIHSAGPKGQLITHIDESKEGPTRRGGLRNIKIIGQHVYVAGMGRQVYCRMSETWHRCDSGVVESLGCNEVSGFQSIDGFSEKEIYAVGYGGEIWLFDGSKWQLLASPTNLILENVLCAPDGVVYVSGQLGSLIRGRQYSWEVVEHDITEDNFWDMVWFNGCLWLSTIYSIFTFKDNIIKEEDMGFGHKVSCRYLNADNEVLWSFGSQDLGMYDGNSWIKIPHPQSS
jgi:hypothetical protein